MAAEERFWVATRCTCGFEMACREGSEWPAECPRCHKPQGNWPPRPDMGAVTLRTRGNGRMGLCAKIENEMVALHRARGWPEPDLDKVLPGFVEQVRKREEVRVADEG